MVHTGIKPSREAAIASCGSTLLRQELPFPSGGASGLWTQKPHVDTIPEGTFNVFPSDHEDGLDPRQRSLLQASEQGKIPSVSCPMPTSRTLCDVTKKAIPREFDPPGYQSAAALLTAVSTSTDAYTAFEQELLEEINRLRHDPPSYAGLIENEATLGYPFICIDDEFYATDTEASRAHEYEPEALLEAVSRVTKTAFSSGREESSLLACIRKGPHNMTSYQSSEHIIPQSKHQKSRIDSLKQQSHPVVNTPSFSTSEPVSGRSSVRSRARAPPACTVAQYRLNKSNMSSSGQTAHTGAYANLPGSREGTQALHLEAPSNVKTVPSTLKKQGVTQMGLEQLGTHFRRHELHRFALEKAAEDILMRWQLAQLALHDMWTMDDDCTTKKVPKNQHAMSKETVLGGTASAARSMVIAQSSSYRKSHERPINTQGVYQQRLEITERVRSIFAFHLSIVLKKLCTEHLICKRAIDGANLILECVQALREVSPLPPLLPRRGLHLAARNLSLFHHTLGDSVSKSSVIGSSSLLLDPLSAGLYDAEEMQFLPLLPNLQDYLPNSPQETVHTKSSQGIIKEWLTNKKIQVGNFFNANTHILLHRVSAEEIARDVACVARMTHEESAKYGQVATQLRGVQLYGSGKPREVIMRAILGVFIPQFILHGTNFSEAVKQGMTTTFNGLLTNQEISRLFKFSIFSRTTRQAEPEPAMPCVDTNIANEPVGMTEYAGVTLCGSYHPMTTAALVQRLSEQDSHSTSRGKRIVSAVQRLGPLLWCDARVVGIGWQRASPPLRHNEPEKSSADVACAEENDPARRSDYVCTTIVLATEYEELEMIATNKYASLDEVDRIVQQCQDLANLQSGNFLPPLTGCSASREGVANLKDLSQATISSSVGDLLVMVDLHSNLGVEVIHPQSHPLLLEVDLNSSCYPSVAVVALRADRERVQIRASLSVSSALNSSSMVSLSGPGVEACPEILLQRSVSDRDVVLIMIDTLSVTTELLRISRGRDGDADVLHSHLTQDVARFLHIFERPIQMERACPVQSLPTVAGYAFIGFIRLVFQSKSIEFGREAALKPSQHKIAIGTSDARLCGAAGGVARGNDVQTSFGLRGVKFNTASTRKSRSQRNEKASQLNSQPSSWRDVFFPPLYESFLSHLDFSARAPLLERFRDHLPSFSRLIDLPRTAVAGASSGWPDVSDEFIDRGGSILSPLVSSLSPDRRDRPVRFAVYLPDDYPIGGIALQQKEALLALLQSLEEAEAVELSKERAYMALIQEEGLKETHTGCADDAEPRVRAGEVCVEKATSEEGAGDVLREADVETKKAVYSSVATNIRGKKAVLAPNASLPESTHEKREPARSKKSAAKITSSDDTSNPSNVKQRKKTKSLSEGRQTVFSSLKTDQKGSKMYLEIPNTFSGLGGAGVGQDSTHSTLARLYSSSFAFSEDGRLELLRLIECPRLDTESGTGKPNKCLPQVITHDILMSISLTQLRNLVDEQTGLLSERRTLLSHIEHILCDEVQRIETEMTKRKGRELMKLKRDEEDINQQLEEMRLAVRRYEQEAERSNEVLTRRTRDQTLRRARLQHVKAHLAALLGSKHTIQPNVVNGDASLDVTESREPSFCEVAVWFIPKDKVPNARRGGSYRFPMFKGPMGVRTSPHLTSTQTSLTFGANNVIQLMPSMLPEHPRSHFYEATVHIPSALRGSAVLLVNGYECAFWEV